MRDGTNQLSVSPVPVGRLEMSMSVYESTPPPPLLSQNQPTHLYTLNNSLLGRLNRGKMADVPNADPVCRRHSWQWQMYSARGLSRGVLKLTAPHWHVAFIFSVSFSISLCRYCRCQLRLRRPIGRTRAGWGLVCK